MSFRNCIARDQDPNPDQSDSCAWFPDTRDAPACDSHALPHGPTKHAAADTRSAASTAPAPPTACATAPILLSHFSIADATQERRGRRVKGARFWRVHRSEAQTLDPAPALCTLAREKRGDFALLFLFNKFACGNQKLLYSNLNRRCALFSAVTLR